MQCDAVFDICVARLSKSLVNPSPVKLLPPNNLMRIKRFVGEEFINVAFGFEIEGPLAERLMEKGGIPLKYNPSSFIKRVQTCEIKESGYAYGGPILYSDCDTRHGNSGSLLGKMYGTEFYVVGVTTYLEYSKDPKAKDGDPYHKTNNSTLHRPVTKLLHDLLDRLERARREAG